MNILFDARYIDQSGIGTYVKTFVAEALRRAKSKKNTNVESQNNTAGTGNFNDIAFLFARQNKGVAWAARLKAAGYEVHWINTVPFKIKEHAELYSILKQLRPKVFHVPHFNVPFLTPSDVIILPTVHDLALDHYPSDFRTPLHKLYYKLNLRRTLSAPKIIVDSEFTKQDLEKVHGYKSASLVLCGFDPELLGAKPAKPLEDMTNVMRGREANHLLYVGINRMRKNLPFLIAAIADLPAEIYLSVVGDMSDWSYDIAQDVMERGLENRVHLLGRVSHEDLARLYSTCWALVVPSLLEGFGYPLLEAAAFGIPVASSSASSLPEVGGDGVHYFSPTDPADCRDKLLELCTSPNLAAELVERNATRPAAFRPAKFFDEMISNGRS